MGGAAGGFYNTVIAYDENSNPTSTTDDAHARNNTAKHPFDVVYGLDDLNRVIAADEGNIASGAIESGTRTRKELWSSLSLTGNWGNRQLDSNGDGDFGDEPDRDEPSAYNTFNKANEWTARRVAKAGGSDRDEHAYTYDAVGNLTDLAATAYRGGNTALTHRRLVYDAFGRLVRVAAVDGMDETDVALYRYNGLNMRLMWHDDADADSTLESSERFYVMFDERWRPVATFRDTDATPKEAFVWHAAGHAGFGGSSYIDSLILRDRDNYTGGTPNGMTSASDGTLEERRYFCQNWRADVVAVTKSDGTPIEYVRYSPYGEPAVYPVADLNMDGVVNSTDSTLWSDLLYSTSNASVYADSDLDFDGADDWNGGGADGDLFYESYSENLGLSGGGRVSSPGVDSRTGYAGYQWDQTLSAYHVRYRVYLPDIGRWTRRDPLGYVDGMGLYEYVGSAPMSGIDPGGRSRLGMAQYQPAPQPGPISLPGGTTPIPSPLDELLSRPIPSDLDRLLQRPATTITPAPQAVSSGCWSTRFLSCLVTVGGRVIVGAGAVCLTATTLGDSTIHYERPVPSPEERCAEAIEWVNVACHGTEDAKRPPHEGKRGTERRKEFCRAVRSKMEREQNCEDARFEAFVWCYGGNWDNDPTGRDHQGQYEKQYVAARRWERIFDLKCHGLNLD